MFNGNKLLISQWFNLLMCFFHTRLVWKKTRLKSKVGPWLISQTTHADMLFAQIWPARTWKLHSCQNHCDSTSPIENPGMQSHMCVCTHFNKPWHPNPNLFVLSYQESNRCDNELEWEDGRWRRRRRQSPHLSISIPVIKKAAKLYENSET